MQRLFLIVALLPAISAFAVQPKVVAQQVARPCMARHVGFPMMQEAPTPEGEAAAPVAATPEPVAPVTPPAPPPAEGIDFTKYSITITLGFVFVLAKALDYFGIIDVN